MRPVLKLNYTRHLTAARKSVRYHTFRSRELLLPGADRVGAFNRSTDHADVASFVRRLDDPATRDEQCAKMHRIMVSLSRPAWDRCGLESWKPVVRESLAAFEKRHGIRLDWVAAEHLDPRHPHVHIDIKSVFITDDGRRRRLRLNNRHREELVLAFQAVLRREMQRCYETRREQLLVERQERPRSTSFRLNGERAARYGIQDWSGLLREAVSQVERYHGVRLEALISDGRDAEGNLVGEVTFKKTGLTAAAARMPLDGRQIAQELHWAANRLVQLERESALLREERAEHLKEVIHDLTQTAIWALEKAGRDDEHDYVQPLIRRRRRQSERGR